MEEMKVSGTMQVLTKFAYTLFIFLSLPLATLSLEKYTPEESPIIYKEYDYVIVGGGTAGAVVASRLSEIPCISVLILEAGPKPPPRTEVPALSLTTWYTNVDWKYRTVPQKHAGNLMINREFPFTTAKVLGGGSTIGDMVYSRGNRKNYDDWASLGAEGWDYENVFPYFLKYEDNRDEEYLSNGYHNDGGPFSVHKPWYYSNIKPVLRETLMNIGYKFVDSNGPNQTGVYDFQATLRDSRRCSTAKGYLVPAEGRKNLNILLNAMVKMIIIENQTATGVEFDYGGHSYLVKAKREVILSAGTVGTPQLLMLSGVGPESELKKHNIPVKANLPVGANLQDHGAVLIPFELSPDTPTIIDKLLNPLSIAEYAIKRTGPYATVSFESYNLFLRGDEIEPDVDFPNYAIALTEVTASVFGIPYLGYTLEAYLKYLSPYELKPLLGCLVEQVQPKSRGSIILRSKNVYDHPLIDPNFLNDSRDIDDLVEGIKTCHKIGTSKDMQKIGSKPITTLVPGCENYVTDTDAYLRCQVTSTMFSIHHPVGTARMGDPKDPLSVVDPELRVKNIKSLRVADASVMPLIPSGNTVGVVLMVAEKASDIIKNDVQCSGRIEEKEIDRDILLYSYSATGIPGLDAIMSYLGSLNDWFSVNLQYVL